jgi:hypothetical protein
VTFITRALRNARKAKHQMSDNVTQQSSNGLGFFGALTILFITLKLTHVIAWSWLWVLAPALIPLAVIGTILLVCGVWAIGAALAS